MRIRETGCGIRDGKIRIRDKSRIRDTVRNMYFYMEPKIIFF